MLESQANQHISLSPETATEGERSPRRHSRTVFRLLIPILLCVELFGSIVCFPPALRGNADFYQFYNGARILRLGYRHQLYDYNIQQKIGGSILPSVHPAYEYLVFLPLSFFSYKAGYLIWLLINLGLTTAIIQLVRPYFSGSGWLLVGIVVAFIPVWMTWYEGQDSLLLLVLLLLAARADEFGAGVWIGLGAFKFHIVVPIIVLYLLWRRWRVALGFCISAGAAAGLSILMVGINGSLHYVNAASGMAIKLLRPTAMPNMHGLLLRLFGARFGTNHAVTALTVLAAIVALYWASRQTPSLAIALLIVPFTTAYLLPYDLALLLLPIVAFDMSIAWAGGVLVVASGVGAGLGVLPLVGDLLKNRALLKPATRTLASAD